MKNQLAIRSLRLIGTALSFTIFLSSCSIFQKNSSKETNQVTINAKTGESTLSNQTNYISKGKQVKFEVNNLNPLTDSIVFIKSERNIDLDGGEFTDNIKKLQIANAKTQEKTEKVRESVDSRISTLNPQNAKNSQNEVTTLTEEEKTKLTILQLEKTVLAQIELSNLEFQSILKRTNSISSEEAMRTLISDAENAANDFNSRKNSFFEETLIDDSLRKLMQIESIHMSEILQFIKSISLTKYWSFQPKKEETEIEVTIYKKGTKQLVGSYNYTFISRNNFKMSGSVGAHIIITDGAFNRAFKNVDSLIVSRQISNIQPSFGTYMNGTWRVNDALLGFGLGLGVPVDGQDNLSPNFSVFFTSLFQTEYGRFGFNAGAAIRQVDILSPGYEFGSNLGNASIDVPTISTWKPGLMIGISYVIGGKEK